MPNTKGVEAGGVLDRKKLASRIKKKYLKCLCPSYKIPTEINKINNSLVVNSI